MNEERRKFVLIAASGPCLLWVVITIGFRINEPVVPLMLTLGFLPALIVVIAALWIGVRHAWMNWTLRASDFSFARIMRERQESNRSMAEHKAWLAKIAADPQRQRYYAMIQAGDSFWTPERVEYDLDCNATASCMHLAPIESAMRAAGIRIILNGQTFVTAECLIDASQLAVRFELPDFASYQEVMMYDRGAEDPFAQIVCSACRAAITVYHPQRAPSGAPVFP